MLHRDGGMMKLLVTATLTLAMLLFISGKASAQVDNFGVLDTVYADIAQIEDNSWTITISYTNDQRVVGMVIPIKLDAGEIPVVADSAVYWGGRVERFTYRGFRPDTTIQSVTMGLIANLGPTKNTLLPGRGRIVTVFVSSLDDRAVTELAVDTTTTPPSNSLMVIADRIQESEDSDTIPIENRRILQIKPAWVVRQSQ